MRKFILAGIALVLTTGIAAAQTHQNTKETTVKDTVIFATDVKVGTTLLKAGEYRVECDRDMIKFFLLVDAKDKDRIAQMTPVEQSIQIGSGKKVLEAPCKGKELSEVRKATQAVVSQKNGQFVLDMLYLRGSNVEHVF
ncbi:MAG: hypothetical protein EPO35_08000 [Acidobacteria bacterium]|nr:MAG: hypothetical protein EPO35_08000 [Acidobacteriota bacterium]